MAIDNPEDRILYVLYSTPDFSFENDKGFVTREVIDAIDETFDHRYVPKSMSAAFASLEESGLLIRNLKGKRTYEVALTDAGVDTAEQLFGGMFTPEDQEPVPANNAHIVDDIASVLSTLQERISVLTTENGNLVARNERLSDENLTLKAKVEHYQNKMNAAHESLTTAEGSVMTALSHVRYIDEPVEQDEVTEEE